MKKILATLLAVVCCCNVVMASALDDQLNMCNEVSSIFSDIDVENMQSIKFGRYPKNDKTGNSAEDIEWLILEKKNGQALLISKYVIDKKNYNDSGEMTTWENSSIRKWLNNDFLNYAFNNNEKSLIIPTQNITSDKNKGTNESTLDSVFLLSDDEARKHFNFYEVEKGIPYVSKKAQTKCTEYALSKKGIEGNVLCSWLLRSYFTSTNKKGKTRQIICEITDTELDDASVDTGGSIHYLDGIRPVIKVKFAQTTMQDKIDKAVDIADELGVTNDVIKEGAKIAVDNVAPPVAKGIIKGAIDKFGDGLLDKIRGNK